MHRLAPLLLVVALLGPTQAACSDPCEDTGCGAPGIYVSWGDETPLGVRQRVCFEGRCHPTGPSGFADDQGEGEDILVGGGSTPEGPVTVRFEAVAADGTVLARYEGEGEAPDGCCSAVHVRTVAPDRLVPYDPDA